MPAIEYESEPTEPLLGQIQIAVGILKGVAA